MELSPELEHLTTVNIEGLQFRRAWEVLNWGDEGECEGVFLNQSEAQVFIGRQETHYFYTANEIFIITDGQRFLRVDMVSVQRGLEDLSAAT